MNKFLTIFLALVVLSGCQTLRDAPAIVYKPQEVKIAVPVFPEIPTVDTFDSRVLKLTDDSKDGEVGQAFKSDWLSLMYRDQLFTDFLQQYRKAKESAQAPAKQN